MIQLLERESLTSGPTGHTAPDEQQYSRITSRGSHSKSTCCGFAPQSMHLPTSPREGPRISTKGYRGLRGKRLRCDTRECTGPNTISHAGLGVLKTPASRSLSAMRVSSGSEDAFILRMTCPRWILTVISLMPK